MGKKKIYAWTNLLFILPSLVGVCIFKLNPYIDVIRRSFMSAGSGIWVGTKNYKITLSNTAFQLAVKNTVRFIGICIPLLLLLSLMVAVCLQKKVRFNNWIKSGFLIPMAIPVASVVLVWRLLFDNNGFLNGSLHALGLNTVDWMNSGWAFWVLVFSYIWKNTGYDIVLWTAGLSTISPSIYEAAKVDGAGEWRCFVSITMPNLMSTLYIISVLSLLNSFKIFREAYLVAGDYPHDSMYMIQHLFNNWFRDMSINKMAAGAVLNSIVMLGLILVFQKLWDR